MNCFFVWCHRRLAAIVACCLIGANASAASFDAAVGYSPAFVLAQTAGLPSASYVRFLGFELRLGLWTSLGVLEATSQYGFEVSPYLQDLSLQSLSLRRYLYRQSDFGPEEFWSQSSSRKLEPYYGMGLGRIQQNSVFLGQTENVEILNIRSWGLQAQGGAEWFPDREQSYAFFAEGRGFIGIWPESVPPFLFSVLTVSAGVRSRF
jgi:hypothetical protein